MTLIVNSRKTTTPRMKKAFLPLLAVAAMVCSSGPTWAADEVLAPVEPSATLPLPPEKQQGNVSYVSGGVPDEQLAAVKQARGKYPLVVELYQKAGAKSEFTSGAQVRLTDKAGKVVLDDRSEGPFMLVKLPPGSYRVQATLNGKTSAAQSVAVAATGSKRAVIVFPQGTD
jgi:hypothetical protein